MGIYSALGGLLGMNGNKKAITNANNAANAGIDKAVGQISGQQTANDAAYSPYTNPGAKASTSIANLLGLNGNDQSSAALEALKNSPLFTSQYDIGNRTVLQDQAATGGVRGGNTTDALAQFGSGLFSNVIQQQLANLMGVSNQGLNAVNANQGMNTGLANGIAGLLDQQGSNNAGAILGKKQATNNAFSGLTNWMDAYSGGSGTGTGSGSGSGNTNGGDIMKLITSLF